MPTASFNADTASGDISSENFSSYSLARAGSSLAANTTDAGQRVGQIDGYYCYEAFLTFDTSSIPDAATIQQVILKIWPIVDGSVTNFTLQAKARDWGATLTTADWVAGASLSALTTVATLSTLGISTSGYNSFTENGSNFRNAINKTGSTRLLICSDRHASGTTPTTNEYISISSPDFSSGAQVAVLEVTYVVAVSLAGNQPSPAGVLASKRFVALAGAQASPAGLVSVRRLFSGVTLAGAQAAPAGALTPRYLFAQRAVAGNQPSDVGAVAGAFPTFIALAGAQPADTGALAFDVTPNIALPGNQPAASGLITPHYTFSHANVSGAQPAPSGGLASTTIHVFPLIDPMQPGLSATLPPLQPGS